MGRGWKCASYPSLEQASTGCLYQARVLNVPVLNGTWEALLAASTEEVKTAYIKTEREDKSVMETYSQETSKERKEKIEYTRKLNSALSNHLTPISSNFCFLLAGCHQLLKPMG